MSTKAENHIRKTACSYTVISQYGCLDQFIRQSRQTQIISEVKEDNAWLEDRIKRLSQENSRLKIELGVIADSSVRLQAPVQKLRFGAPCRSPSVPHCTDKS